MVEVTLVDFFSFFYRASLASFTQQLSVNGETTGILFNLYRSYGYIVKNFRNVVLCFDGRMAKSVRKSMFGQYKSNRESFKQKYQQMNIYKWKDEFLSSVPYYYSINDAYEGDDLIATLVRFLNSKNIKVNILTVDSDLWQLIEFGKVDVYDLKHKYRLVDEEYFQERFSGLKYPFLVPVYKVIFGDASDNIPKAIKPRIRKKPIVETLNSLYEKGLTSLQDILEEVYKLHKDKFEVSDIDELFAYLHLVTLFNNITFEVNYFNGDKQKYEQLCKMYHFNMVPKFDEYLIYLSKKSGSVSTIFGVSSSSEVDELL
jgi:5'-3' exonuclease